MPPVEAIERPYFYAMPVWMVAAFYLIAAAALAVFFYGAYGKIRKYALGRKDAGDRPTWRGFFRAVLGILGNRTILRGDLLAGSAHLLAFWGFAILYVATLLVLVDNDVLKIFIPQWRFLRGDFYLWFSWTADAGGVLLLAGLALLLVRRGLMRPAKLSYTRREEAKSLPPPGTFLRDDWIFVGLMALLGVGGFALEAVRIQATARPAFERVSFVGWALSSWLGGLSFDSAWAQGAFPYFWMAHALAGLAMVAYLPYSKAFHMLAGWYTLALKESGARPGVLAGAATESGGYSRIEDLTRAQLVMLDACVRCGRCQDACPASNSGYPLSPRDLVLALRAHAEAAAPRALHAKAMPAFSAEAQPRLAGGVVPGPWLWSCTTCLSCDEICPLGIHHVPLLVQMRRLLVSEGDVETRIQDALTNLQRYGNSFGSSPRNRAKWTQGLEFKVKDARKEPVEYLWLTGDYAAFDPRVQPVTRSVARLLARAGVDFGILYEAEQNSGNDVRRVGEEGLFEMLMEKNLAAFGKARFRHVVTSDPHTYHALKNEYRREGDGIRILHYTELLDELIRAGRLVPQRRVEARVTYHDPCYLGRYNGVYDAPRRMIAAAGAVLAEMPRHGADSYCCGAGGGHVWMEDVPGIKERPAESRVREAAALEGVKTLVVSCPKDLVMFLDALKTTGLEGSLAVRDAAELMEEAIGPKEEERPA